MSTRQTKLLLEISPDLIKDKTVKMKIDKYQIFATPPIGKNYWLYRVKLHNDQAIIGFPKFNQVGIGFAQEEDWNTNLPSRCEAKEIFEHIKINKKYDEIDDQDCIKAIEIIKEAVERFGTV